MLWPEKIPKGPEFYTHPKWKKNGASFYAEQSDLPEIILYDKTVRERRDAIRLLRDENVRAELACKVHAVEEIWALISGIRSQLILFRLASNSQSEDVVRLYAINWIYEPETLRLIADTESKEVRAKAFARMIELADTPERLKMLANDEALPLYDRMTAALRLADGPAILDLYGTAIYHDSDIVHTVIDKYRKPKAARKE